MNKEKYKTLSRWLSFILMFFLVFCILIIVISIKTVHDLQSKVDKQNKRVKSLRLQLLDNNILYHK